MRFSLLILIALSCAQGSSLREKIAGIAAEAKGKVSVACYLAGAKLDCDLNAGAKSPMQSVFKFPLVLTALHQVDEGKLAMDQPVHFGPEDRILPKTYSPLQDKYPNANVDIPMRELMRLAVTLSDNAAADLVLRTVGGPKAVDEYMHAIGVQGFQLMDGEAELHRNDTAQYRNWFEAKAAVGFLDKFSSGKLLQLEQWNVLQGWLRDTPTGMKRIKGLLPAGTEVLHKTGTSGVREGVAAATNDIGLVRLPDGRQVAIAIFVTDARADEATRESVMARIARAIYDAALETKR